MEAKVLLCPIIPRLTPNVLDIAIRKRAVRIPRVLVAKLENTKEGRNNLPVEAVFSPWLNTSLPHQARLTDTKSN
jgi:hypothetical protein